MACIFLIGSLSTEKFSFHLFIICLHLRSAPASPSHTAGTFTPDSLSRESSPIPEGFEGDIHSQPGVMTHPQILTTQQAAELYRISQSAPGSPAGMCMSAYSVGQEHQNQIEMILSWAFGLIFVVNLKSSIIYFIFSVWMVALCKLKSR